MLKKIGLVALGLAVGLLIGGVGVMAHYGYSLARGMIMLQEADLVRAEEAATQAYLNEAPEVGIWAMEDYLAFFEDVIAQRMAAVEEKHAQGDVFVLARPEMRWVSYVRLALLYEKADDHAKRDEAFQKAAAIFDKEVTEGTVEDYMREFVHKWDEQESTDFEGKEK